VQTYNFIYSLWPRNNNIIYLPRNINNLKRLDDLMATGNPNLSGPPQWVVAQGMPGIRNFYDALSRAEFSLSLEIVNQASCTAVPQDLFHLSSLTALTISGCPVNNMPDDVCMMLCLTSLEISHCNLKKLPSMLCKCLKMTSINLQGNVLSSLPIGWAELTNMNSLSLAQNRFELVPPCIQYYMYLSWLDMCDNFLASIPSWYDYYYSIGLRLIQFLTFTLTQVGHVALLGLSGNGKQYFSTCSCSCFRIR
jgi:Leucine-rich repeat (LRR) protein